MNSKSAVAGHPLFSPSFQGVGPPYRELIVLVPDITIVAMQAAATPWEQRKDVFQALGKAAYKSASAEEASRTRSKKVGDAM